MSLFRIDGEAYDGDLLIEHSRYVEAENFSIAMVLWQDTMGKNWSTRSLTLLTEEPVIRS
jgi:hypothetical protein